MHQVGDPARALLEVQQRSKDRQTHDAKRHGLQPQREDDQQDPRVGVQGGARGHDTVGRSRGSDGRRRLEAEGDRHQEHEAARNLEGEPRQRKALGPHLSLQHGSEEPQHEHIAHDVHGVTHPVQEAVGQQLPDFGNALQPRLRIESPPAHQQLVQAVLAARTRQQVQHELQEKHRPQHQR